MTLIPSLTDLLIPENCEEPSPAISRTPDGKIVLVLTVQKQVHQFVAVTVYELRHQVEEELHFVPLDIF